MGVMGFLRWDLSHSCAAYETYYTEELADAFASEKQKRKQLIYAYGLFHEKRYPEALEPLQSLLNRSSTAADRRAVLLAMALCLNELGYPGKAEQLYLALLQIAPECSTARSNLGLLLLEQGRYLEAEAQLRRAVSQDRTNAHAWLNLGALHLRRGQYTLAIPPLEEAASRNEKLYAACTALAGCYAGLEDWDRAKEWMDLAVHRGQDFDEIDRAIQRTHDILPDLEALSPEELEQYRRWKERTGRPSIIAGLGPVPAGRSYVGGEALGEPPRTPDGEPMVQLAAIYCEEFPDAGLPAEGLIRIFIADNSRYGMDPEHPNVQSGFRVLYDREFSHLTPSAQRFSDSFPVRSKLWLSVHTRVRQPMPAWNFRFGREFGGEAGDALCEVLNDAYHRIGGYPCSYQSDPRERAELDRYDQLLLQLDTMNWGEWSVIVGDGGCLKFCVPSEKLAAGEVSDVLYWWD